MKRISYAVIVCGLLATSASFAEDVKVGGGAAPMENVFKKIKDPLAAKGVNLILNEQGPDVAWKELDAGNIEAASAGLAFKDWQDMMAKKEYTVKDASIYKQRIIGRDRIQVLMHPGLSGIKKLDKDQLKAIFSGKTKNWKEVGGPDLAVVLVVGTKIPGTVKMWQQRILDGDELGKNGADAGTIPEIQKTIAATPGSVGIGSLGAEAGKIHAPEDIPDVSRPITVITKGEPSAGMKKVFDFIGGEGQKLISK